MPSIFFRIAPILELELQDEQPGMLSCTTFSAASATEPNNTTKLIAKQKLSILFILSPLSYCIFD